MKNIERINNLSPLDPISTILSGAPGIEAAMCLTLPAELSLFEPNSNDASVLKAREDHDRMREVYTQHGIATYNMREVIGRALVEKRSVPSQIATRDKFLKEVRKRTHLLQRAHGLVPNFDLLIGELEQLLDKDIKSMDLEPAIAINAVLSNILDVKGNLKPFDPFLPPAGNFMFVRDTSHTLGNRLGTHQMFFSIRQQEVVLATLGFNALGLDHSPTLASSNIGSIEGGDVLTMELDNQLFALLGTAERTSQSAVEDWFRQHEDLFRSSGEGVVPLIVSGPTENTQDQMHLDTFAQQVAMGSVIHCGEITGKREVHYLMRRGGEIAWIKPENLRDGTFAEWIESKADHVLDMSRAAQLNYDPNVLVHGNGSGETTVFTTRKTTQAVEDFIRGHALRVVNLMMEELTKCYGGAHCATNEFRTR